MFAIIAINDDDDDDAFFGMFGGLISFVKNGG